MPASLKGYVNDWDGRLRVEGSFPYFIYNDTRYESATLLCENPSSHFDCKFRGSMLMDSGAMITAREAQALEKPIYALPGRIDDKEAEGPMQLLTEGARILRSEACIAEDFKNRFMLVWFISSIIYLLLV